jgi:hypothetical protein
LIKYPYGAVEWWMKSSHSSLISSMNCSNKGADALQINNLVKYRLLVIFISKKERLFVT